MSSALKLQVVLQALDKATAPIRQITQSTGTLQKSLGASQGELKRLQDAQKKLTAFEQLRVQATQSNSAIRENQQRLAAVTREINNSTAPTKALLNERDKLTRQSATLNTRYQQERSKMAELTRQLKGTDTGTGKLADRKRYLVGRIDDATQAVDKHKAALAKLNAQQQRTRELSEYGSKLKQTGQTTAMHGAGATALGGAGLRGMWQLAGEGMSFDATMSKVQAMARIDKDSDQMKMLRDQAKQLGAETMFSANDAARGQAFLAIAGFTPESIHAAMPGLLDMALAGDVDLGRTADIASNILGGFGMDASQMGKVADVLTKAFTTSNISLESLGETMKYVGPVASAAGMDLEEAAAMAGLLGNVGIQGSQAGTTLKAMVLRLSAPAAAGRKALEGLGLSAVDAQGNLRSMPTILSEVAAATKDMGTGQQLEYLKQIFGAEPAAGMAEIVKQAGMGGLMDYISQIYDNEGAARNTAKTMADNLIGDLDELSSAWDGLKLDVFEDQNSGLRGLTQNLTGVLGKVAVWMKENPALVAGIVKWGAITLGIITVLGTLAILIGTGMMALGGMIKMYAALSGSMAIAIKTVGLLGKAFFVMGKLMMANPIILAIALLAAAAYLLWRNWDDVVGGLMGLFADLANSTRFIWEPLFNFFKGIWSKIKTAFDGGILGISALIINWSPLGLFYKAFAGVLGWFGVDLPGKFTEFGGNLITALINGIKTMFGGLMHLFSGAWAEIKTAFNGGLLGVSQLIINWSPLGLFYKAFAGVLSWFGIDLPGKFTAFGGMLVNGLITGIKAVASGIAQVVTGIWTSIKTAFAGGIGGVSALIINWSPLGLFYKAFAGVLNWFGVELPASFTEFGANMISGLVDGIKSMAGQAKEAISNVGDNVTGWFKEKLGIRSPSRVFMQLGGDTMDGLTLGLQAQQDGPLKQIAGLSKQLLAAAGLALPMMATAQPVAELPTLPPLPQQVVLAQPEQELQQLPTLLQRVALAQPAVDLQPVQNIRFDSRVPLAQPPAQPVQPAQSNQITIHVHAAPGMNEQELARLVQRELDKAQRQQQARKRSTFGDLD